MNSIGWGLNLCGKIPAAPVVHAERLLAEQFFWKKSCGSLRKSSDFFYGIRQKFSDAVSRRAPLRSQYFSN